MNITTIYWVWISLIIILSVTFAQIIRLKNKDLNIYKKRCDQYLKTYEHICESAVGCLHISQIDEHKAPEIYLEIYKGSYQRILDRSMLGCCIVLDSVVDSQDKQAL